MKPTKHDKIVRREIITPLNRLARKLATQLKGQGIKVCFDSYSADLFCSCRDCTRKAEEDVEGFKQYDFSAGRYV